MGLFTLGAGMFVVTLVMEEIATPSSVELVAIPFWDVRILLPFL